MEGAVRRARVQQLNYKVLSLLGAISDIHGHMMFYI
jgi:hypothetical protein